MSSPVYQGDPSLKRLQKSCEVTLERLTSVANDLCSLTKKLQTLPISKDKRLEIFLHKKREDEALQAYQRARDALLAAVAAKPESMDTQDVSKG